VRLRFDFGLKSTAYQNETQRALIAAGGRGQRPRRGSWADAVRRLWRGDEADPHNRGRGWDVYVRGEGRRYAPGEVEKCACGSKTAWR
jgi:hypothetical protein